MMTPSAAMFLVLIGVWLPYLAWKSARQLGTGALPLSRSAFFLQVIGTQAFLFAAGVFTASRNRISLWRPPHDPLVSWTAAVVFLLLLLASLKWRWSAKPLDSKRRLFDILPHDARELRVYAFVALSAGIAEEIVYRGVLTTLLTRLTGSFVLAGFASAAVFGVSHLLQGWRAVITIFGIALLSQWLVAFTGSLLPVMAVHALYDLVAGVVIPRWYVRDGLATSPLPGGAEEAAAGQ
jgi:membrane protease YdiL (CAAX protease family)